jgi:hypothetical protein
LQHPLIVVGLCAILSKSAIFDLSLMVCVTIEKKDLKFNYTSSLEEERPNFKAFFPYL